MRTHIHVTRTASRHCLTLTGELFHSMRFTPAYADTRDRKGCTRLVGWGEHEHTRTHSHTHTHTHTLWMQQSSKKRIISYPTQRAAQSTKAKDNPKANTRSKEQSEIETPLSGNAAEISWKAGRGKRQRLCIHESRGPSVVAHSVACAASPSPKQKFTPS
jgi:hypothetical protein